MAWWIKSRTVIAGVLGAGAILAGADHIDTNTVGLALAWLGTAFGVRRKQQADGQKLESILWYLRQSQLGGGADKSKNG